MLFSEPKIPQFDIVTDYTEAVARFSALQRAENSSIGRGRCARSQPNRCFSALQRAENSSIKSPLAPSQRVLMVSVLFSEPKIPQFALKKTRRFPSLGFSALQRAENSSIWIAADLSEDPALRFSALQRAENSSIRIDTARWNELADGFSALQRAENSSIDVSADAG